MSSQQEQSQQQSVRQAVSNKHYGYYNDILRKISKGEQVGFIEINGLGGRLGGKTYAGLDFLCSVMAICPKPHRILGMGVRDTVGDSQELWDDLLEHLEEMYGEQIAKVSVNLTKKRAIVNGHTLRVIGLKTNRKGRIVKTGIKRLKKGSYVVLLIDEAYQVDKGDYQALLEATADAISVIVIRTANPFSRANWYVEYCCKHLRHNVKELKNEATGGQQFKVVKKQTKIGEKTIESTHIFHYTNWRTNAEYLSDTTKQIILSTWNIDPYRARVVDYGLPMMSQGAIYARLMDKLIELMPQDYALFNEYYIGVDFGTVDATAGIFIATTDNYEKVGWIDEYYHDNMLHGYRDSRQTAIEIVAKIPEFMKLNPNSYNSGIEMYVDNSAPAYIVILKEEVQRQGLERWVSVRGSEKPPILDRINAITLVMGQSRILARRDKLEWLLKELELAEWDTEKSKPTRKDGNDHSINALEYAKSRILYRMIERYDIINLWPARSK